MSSTMRKTVTASLFAVALSIPAAAQTMSLEELAKVFAYDSAAPLDVKESGVEERAGARVHDLTYASPQGGRVPAYLVMPPGKGPVAGIVFMHWGQGNRSEFLAEALLLARAGAASIMIDAPYWRPDYKQGPCNPERGEYVQMINDLRRALDVLLSHPEVDKNRLAYVGHSLGATWGGTLAVVERRFRSHVLMGGLPSLADAIREDVASSPPLPPDRKKKLEDCLNALEPIESIRHVGKAAPAAILFQFARVDRFISEKAARQYFDAASEPKVVKWYQGGHEFSDPAALVDRMEWLEQRLQLKPVRPILRDWMGMQR